MKTLVVNSLLSLLFINCSTNRFNNYKSNEFDSIYVNSKLIFDSIQSSGYVEIVICNFTKDSLIFLPNPFFTENNIFDSTFTSVSSTYGFSTPNIIYFIDESKRIQFDADGEYKPFFRSFPEIYTVNPIDSIVMNVQIPTVVISNLNKEQLDYFGVIVYGSKKVADSLYRGIELNMREKHEHQNKYNFENQIKPLSPESFQPLLTNNSDENEVISNYIWTIFNMKLFFRK
jgi:hypothetical protein